MNNMVANKRLGGFRMRKSRKFISMPIVSLEEGIQLGAVRNLVVDPVKMEIAAVIIDQRGWFREQKIIPYSKVRSVGNDAITIDQSANVQKTVSLPEILKLIKERANPVGTRVIAENGTVLGVVDEFNIDEETGKITSLEVAGKRLESLFKGKALLPISYVRTMGSDVIVVTTDAQDNLEKLDGGLQETFQNIREGTSSLLESTVQRTKEISKNIKEKYEKRTRDKENGMKDGTLDSSGESQAEQTASDNTPGLEVTGQVEIKNEDVLPDITTSEKQPAAENEEAEQGKKDEAGESKDD